jgi:hypothetical protein
VAALLNASSFQHSNLVDICATAGAVQWTLPGNAAAACWRHCNAAACRPQLMLCRDCQLLAPGHGVMLAHERRPSHHH